MGKFDIHRFLGTLCYSYNYKGWFSNIWLKKKTWRHYRRDYDLKPPAWCKRCAYWSRAHSTNISRSKFKIVKKSINDLLQTISRSHKLICPLLLFNQSVLSIVTSENVQRIMSAWLVPQSMASCYTYLQNRKVVFGPFVNPSDNRANTLDRIYKRKYRKGSYNNQLNSRLSKSSTVSLTLHYCEQNII